LRKRVPARILSAQRSGNRFVEVSYRAFFSDLFLIEDRPEEARADCLDAILNWLPESTLFGNQDLLATRSLSQVATYAGDAEEQWKAMLEERWHRYDHSLMARVTYLQEDSLQVRLGLDLCRYRQAMKRGAPSEAKVLLARCRRWLARLSKIELPLGRANASRLRACFAAASGDEGRLPELLRVAIGDAEAQGSVHLVSVLKIRLARVVGGSEGDKLTAEAAAWMNEHEIKNVPRLVAQHTPGWED
jgi:hypothetical protein